MTKTHISFFAMLISIAMLSCSDDDGQAHSRLTAEMCDMHVSSGVAYYAVNDNNEKLVFSPSVKVSDDTPGDTTYRVMLYYEPNITSQGVTPLSLKQVPVLSPQKRNPSIDLTSVSDPLLFRSAWISSNGKYLNLDIGLRNGTSDEGSGNHLIALVKDTTVTSGTYSNHKFVLCHRQNGIPEFYTTYIYFSMPLVNIAQGDTVTVSIPSKDGRIERSWVKNTVVSER